MRRLVTPDEVAESFRRATGDTLRIDRFSVGVSELTDAARLGFDGPVETERGEQVYEPTPPELRVKYGKFSIHVYQDPDRVYSPSFGDPDDEGRYFVSGIPERGPGAGEMHWSVHKIYGCNVRLSWAADETRGNVDERWYRLDAALSALAAPADS